MEKKSLINILLIFICITTIVFFSYNGIKFYEFRENISREAYKQLITYSENLQLSIDTDTKNNEKSALFLEEAKNNIHTADKLLSLSKKNLSNLSLNQDEINIVLNFFNNLNIFISHININDLENDNVEKSQIVKSLAVINKMINVSCSTLKPESFKAFFDNIKKIDYKISVDFILNNSNNYEVFSRYNVTTKT